MQGITECFLKHIYHSWAQLSYKIIPINIQYLNAVVYEIGFRLEEFFFSVFFFIIHLLDDDSPCFIGKATKNTFGASLIFSP